MFADILRLTLLSVTPVDGVSSVLPDNHCSGSLLHHDVTQSTQTRAYRTPRVRLTLLSSQQCLICYLQPPPNSANLAYFVMGMK